MIRIKNLDFAYPDGRFSLHVDALDFAEGGRFCLRGPSGSGKTTLVNIIAGILKPTAGSVTVAGQEISRSRDKANREFRLNNIGFIFQNFELLDYLNVEQNILLPFSIGRKMKVTPDVRRRIDASLERMGIADKKRVYPGQLSQGEQQRVAICRAVVNEPALIIADEPTANLDERNAANVIDLIGELLDRKRATFLMVTHDRSFDEFFDDLVDIDAIASFEAAGNGIGPGSTEGGDV